MKCFLDPTALFKPFYALRQFNASRTFQVPGSMFKGRQTQSTLARCDLSKDES